MSMATLGQFASMWHLHGVASVIGHAVKSVYPQYGGHTVRAHLNRLIEPREAMRGIK
jgi:hypothetical protein